MGYKGRREAPRSEKSPEERAVRHDPFAAPSAPALGDPFAEDSAPSGGAVREPKTPKRSLADRWGDFWDSGKGKILVAVVGCLAVFALVVGLVLKAWIKPPELPGTSDSQTTPGTAVKTPIKEPGDETPAGPTDDELYPDDGYTGDMPTVSGNRKEGVYTFLLVGTDMDDGNTDTIMVVSYDTKEQDVNIMSIPRDTMINERWDIKKINSIYSRTGNSVDSLASRVQKLVGFKPDFYVKVELEMFVELVDLVKGVEFDVPQDMDYDDPYQDLHIHLKKGLQTLDGEHAMQLVRFRRYDMGDIQRVEVQQSFMKALIKKCLSLEHWGKIKAYIDLAMKNVETDLDAGSVVWFAANVLGLNGTPALNMGDVYTCTLPGNYLAETWSRSIQDQLSYVTIYPREVVKLVNERFNPYEQQVTTAMLDAMSILSNGDIASSTGSVRDTQHNAIMAVRRGEAYYDEDGNLVYGPPPVKPEQDEDGNYFILDEDGKVVYTDADGTPLSDEPTLPPDENQPGSPVGPGDPITLPMNPVDNNPGQTVEPPPSGDPGAADPGQQPGQQPGGDPAPSEDPNQSGSPGETLPTDPGQAVEPPPAEQAPEPEPAPVPDLVAPGWL